MKNSKFLLILAIFLKLSINANSQNTETKTYEINKVFDISLSSKFYLVSVTAFADIDSTIAKVKELRLSNKDVNYLWLPDYESLSNKPLYLVFLGPYSDRDSCIKVLSEYKKQISGAYAVLAQHNKTREVIFSWSDIRIDNVKQKLILSYSNPKDLEEYTGEDWGFRNSDVCCYFSKFFSNAVITGNIYNGALTSDEITALEKELNLSGFGFVLINGKEKFFVSDYSISTSLLSEICDYFNLDFSSDDFIENCY